MNNETQGSFRDWSTLPVDILSLLLQRLNNTDTDCRRLRAVCTSWRSSLRSPAPPMFPVNTLPPEKELPIAEIEDFPEFDDVPEFDDLPSLILPKYFDLERNVGDIKEFGIVRQSIFYLISLPNQSGSSSSSSSCGPTVWLTRVEEKISRLSPDRNAWKLQNPLSSVHHFRKLPELNAVVNSFEYRMSEVARSYCVTLGGIRAFKVIMLLGSSSQDAAGANLYLLSLRFGDLMLFKPGEEKWVEVPEVRNSNHSDTVNDILAYQGKFYAVNFMGKLIAIDPITCQVKQVIKSQFEHENCVGLHCYLVESCGTLYLVQKFVHCNFFYNERFDEYETDYRNGNPLELKVFALAYSSSPHGDFIHYWEPVTCLGDRVFFVSNYVTFSVSAKECGWDRGNCIFFCQEGFSKSEYSMFTEENIFYESKPEYCGRISKYCGLYSLEDCRIVTADDLPSKYTNLFWPVPSWLGGCPNN